MEKSTKKYSVKFRIFDKYLLKVVDAYDTAHARFLVEEELKRSFQIDNIEKYVPPPPKEKKEENMFKDIDIIDFLTNPKKYKKW